MSLLDWNSSENSRHGITDSFKWESFYIDEYQNQFGLLPTFNRISGHG